MSAFAVIYERSNVLVQPGALDRLMMRLNHRHFDSTSIKMFDHVHLGHYHFWTTPEDIGEQQPLQLDGFPFTIVFDGRIDNREDLLRSLAIFDQPFLSDAALVLRAYDHWGSDCFRHFVGEFACAIVDHRSGELICARDPLGDRTLFYSLSSVRAVIASEAWAVAAEQGTRPVLEEVAIAHMFAYRPMLNGQTVFQGVYELKPAEVMIISSQGEYRHTYWEPDLDRKIRYRLSQEYADEFRALLEQAIKSRMRSSTDVGILMSGGLDSTSVAALAARMRTPMPITTLSRVFDRFPDCDERQYIVEMERQWNIRSIQIPCDDTNPFDVSAKWIQSYNLPYENPFRVMHERMYKCAQDNGMRVLLTGGFGDHLYGNYSDWLADLLADGKWSRAARDTIAHLRSYSLSKVLKLRFFQRLVRRMINALPGGVHIHRKSLMPEWLTSFAARCVLAEEQKIPLTYKRNRGLVSLRSSIHATYGHGLTDFYSVELRHPYRDLRLVEYILALPAYQLYAGGIYKVILRNAMQGILPERIRDRHIPTSMHSFLSQSLREQSDWIDPWLRQEDQNWSKYIDQTWLLDHWEKENFSKQDNHFPLIFWLCFSFQIWYKDIYSQGDSYVNL